MCSRRKIIKDIIISLSRLAHMCSVVLGACERTRLKRKESIVSITKERETFARKVKGPGFWLFFDRWRNPER